MADHDCRNSRKQACRRNPRQTPPRKDLGRRNTVELLHDNDSGQDLIEYVLIAGLVAISAIGVMSNLAAQVQTALQSFVQAVPNL